MDCCDVLIVGGGPAGSSCAWGLRSSGLDVAILDKHSFPRDKVCGGWITPGVLTDLEIEPSEYAQQRLLQAITAFRVGSIGGPTRQTDYGQPVSYGIRRREFDDYLLRRSGARLLPPRALTSLARSQDGWIANGEIQARVLIGAGGHFCPVARFLGANARGEMPVVAQETEFEMTPRQRALCHVHEDTPELYFCSDMKGYGWCFRKENFLNVGLGRADPHRLTEHVSGFFELLRSAGRVSFELPSVQGHAYLLYGTSPRELVGDGFVLIGDAAGLAYPQSGEGIRPAIESGLVAAQSILAANGQYSKERLQTYGARIAAWRPPSFSRIGRYLPSRCLAFVGRQLLRTRWFPREVVLNDWFLQTS